MRRELGQAEGNKASGQLQGREARHTALGWCQPEAALAAWRELGRAFPSPTPYGAGPCPELTPPLPAGQALGSRLCLSQDKTPCRNAIRPPICFFRRKSLHWLFELHRQRRLFTRRGEGEGLFLSHIFCFNLCRQKSLLPWRRYGYGSDHCAGACEQEKAKRRGGGEPGAPCARSRDGPDAFSGPSLPKATLLSPPDGNEETVPLRNVPRAGSVTRTSRGMSLRGRARRSSAPRLPGDVNQRC